MNARFLHLALQEILKWKLAEGWLPKKPYFLPLSPAYILPYTHLMYMEGSYAHHYTTNAVISCIQLLFVGATILRFMGG